MSVIEKLITIQSCKEDIKQAITDKGVDMTNVAFTEYATKISEIQTGGGSGDPEGGSADYLELRANLRDYQSNVYIVPNGAFIYCYDLTSIDLPNCKYVGQSAFENCSMLRTVNIPNAESIEEKAFKGCNFTSIDLPNCKYVGQSAFENCSMLRTVNIPKLTEISANMFKNCYSLGQDFESPTPQHIDLPSVQIINDSAFLSDYIIKSVSAPNLTRICSNAFNQCGSLDTLDISGSYWCDLENINAFEGTSLMLGAGEIHVPNSSLSKYQNDPVWSVLSDRFVGVGDADKTLLAFDNGRLYGETAVLNDNFTDFLGITKEDVTSIDLPNCLKIGDMMFGMCNLTSIDLPNCLEIGDGAFQGNSQLSSVNLPKCERIGSGAFEMCNLTSIDLPNCLEIGDHAFSENAQLSSINLPKCERIGMHSNSIGSGAFDMCNLQSIDLPNCLEIGDSAFMNNMQLSSINLPKCEIIGMSAFDMCNLTSIDLPNCLEIGDNAFQGNTQLSSVNLPKCEIIYGFAFSNNEALTSIDLPNIKYILDHAFANNMNLQTITIGNTESVCELEAVTAFESTSLGTIYVPNNLVGQYKSDMVWGQLDYMIVGI